MASSFWTVDGFPLRPILRIWLGSLTSALHYFAWPIVTVYTAYQKPLSLCVEQGARELDPGQRRSLISTLEGDQCDSGANIGKIKIGLENLSLSEQSLRDRLEEIEQYRSECDSALDNLGKQPRTDVVVDKMKELNEKLNDSIPSLILKVQQQLLLLRDERVRLLQRLESIVEQRFELTTHLEVLRDAEEEAQSQRLSEEEGASTV